MSVTLWLFLWDRIFHALLKMRIGYLGGTLVTATFIINSSSDKPAESKILNERSFAGVRLGWENRMMGWGCRGRWEDTEIVMWAPGEGGWRMGGWIQLWFCSCFQWGNKRQNHLAIWVSLSYENSLEVRHILFPCFSFKASLFSTVKHQEHGCAVSLPAFLYPSLTLRTSFGGKKITFYPLLGSMATAASLKAHEWSLLSRGLSILDPLLWKHRRWRLWKLILSTFLCYTFQIVA